MAAITVDFLGKDKSLGSTMSSVDGKTSKLGATMKKVAIIGGALLAGAAIVAGKALFGMVKAAAADQQAQVKLATALKNSTGATDAQVASVEKWISAQGTALGVTDDELRPALEKLTSATHDISKAQALASLAMDVSAGTGKSLEQVSTALMKAQNGQIAGLSKLGVKTKNAAGETITLEQATKQLADTHGGQAAAKANTFQGKMDRLKLVFDETKEAIGAKLLPVLTRLASWFLAEGLPAISAFGGWITTNLFPIFTQIGALWGRVMGSMSGGTDGAVSKIRTTIAGIVTIFQQTVAIVQALWKLFGDNILNYAKTAFAAIAQVISGAFNIIRGIFQTVSALLKGDWQGVWDGIQLILKGAWQMIQGIVKQGLNMIKFAMSNAWVVIKALVGAAWNGIQALVKLGVEKMVELLRSLPGKIRAGLAALPGVLRTIFTTAMNAGLELVKAGATKVLDAIKAIPTKILELGGKFLTAGKTVMGKIFEGIKSAFSGVGGFVGDLMAAIKNGINSALHLPFTINGPGPLPDFTIPAFAKGGVSKGGVAVVGEQGPELVDLPRGARVTSHRKSMAELNALPTPRGGGNMTAEINLMLPGGKVLERMLIQWGRESGRPLQIQTLST